MDSLHRPCRWCPGSSVSKRCSSPDTRCYPRLSNWCCCTWNCSWNPSKKVVTKYVHQNKSNWKLSKKEKVVTKYVRQNKSNWNQQQQILTKNWDAEHGTRMDILFFPLNQFCQKKTKAMNHLQTINNKPRYEEIFNPEFIGNDSICYRVYRPLTILLEYILQAFSFLAIDSINH